MNSIFFVILLLTGNSGLENQPLPNDKSKNEEIIFQSIDDQINYTYDAATAYIYDEETFPKHNFAQNNNLAVLLNESDPDAIELSGSDEIKMENGNKLTFTVFYNKEDEYRTPWVQTMFNDVKITQWLIPKSHLGFAGFNSIFIFPDNNEEFYLIDNSGHEAMSRHYYYDGQNFINYDDVMKALLGSEFEDYYFFPPYSLEVSPSYLKFTEKTYCCDSTIDPKNEELVKYGQYFILDRKTLEILEKGKFERPAGDVAKFTKGK
jgi:hypothetical protein